MGCTCKPTYSIRGAAGTSHERIGKDLRDALRALAKVSTQLDEGTYVPPKATTYGDYADAWLASLRRPKDGTVAGYGPSILYAKEAFGGKRLRALTVDDVDALVRVMASRGLAASTINKHLRVVGSSLKAAQRRGLIGFNPIDRFDNRPRSERRESAYFENDELPPLFAAFPVIGFEETFGVLARLCLWTGIRSGEARALVWGEVDLGNAHLRIRRGIRQHRLSDTKGRENRTVDLQPRAVELLGAWWGKRGFPEADALVFPDERGGFIEDTRPLYWLRKAMETAGVPKAGPTGEDRDWHSLRHTYARIALENGVPLYAVSRQLGHSSQAVTDKHYGHFAREAAKAEVQKLAEAFPV